MHYEFNVVIHQGLSKLAIFITSLGECKVINRSTYVTLCQSEKGNVCYLYDPSNNTQSTLKDVVWSSKIILTPKRNYRNPDADTDSNHVLHPIVIVASSPNSAKITQTANSFFKVSSYSWYDVIMTQWTLDEVREVAKYLRDVRASNTDVRDKSIEHISSQDLSDAVLEERFNIVGGSIRLLFLNTKAWPFVLNTISDEANKLAHHCVNSSDDTLLLEITTQKSFNMRDLLSFHDNANTSTPRSVPGTTKLQCLSHALFRTIPMDPNNLYGEMLRDKIKVALVSDSIRHLLFSTLAKRHNFS